MPAAWPENWRDQLAEALKPGDKKFRGRLDRFSAITDIGKSWLGLEERVSSGELKAKAEPPANATPEQLSAWRKEQGLPVSAADYVANIKLADGVVPGEADKPLLEAVGKMALESGYDQNTVNNFVGLYYSVQDSLIAQRDALDVEQRDATVAQLAREQGPDFQKNKNALNLFWSERPPEVKSAVLGARTADGRLVGDIPEVVKFFANLSRELNPAAAVLPSGAPADLKAVGTRKAEIEGLMFKDSPTPGKYGPGYTAAVQEEYRQLIDAETTMKARSR